MQDEKAEIRRNLLARRMGLGSDEIAVASQEIARKVPGATDWQHVRIVHVYRSLASLGEVDTQPIIDWLAASHPEIQVTIGQSEPNVVFPSGQFDVIFVPVVGFDRGGNRLGMGGGWYDRWLTTQPHALKIGLAYAWAGVEYIPRESHDIPVLILEDGRR
ncbi:hypothetical protein IPL68_00315 [Candidatus Saccharibacteria bacterium]|nr:MAG: hypothetical protein IPL68_00315 [Candidatus Saccharibacteria bacterium]